MMRDEDKPFICYRKSKWNLQIMPRNRAGWLALAVWVGGLLAVVHTLIWAVFSRFSETTLAKVLVLMGIIVIAVAWAIAMTRWMLARSEIISIDDVLDFRRDRQRRKDRNRRG